MKRTTALLVLVLAASALAQSAAPHGVRLACTGSAGATFNVYRATATGAEAKPPLATNLSSCAYDDTSAVIGTKYFYTMTQTVGGVESGPSQEVSAQIVLPTAPTNASATVF